MSCIVQFQGQVGLAFSQKQQCLFKIKIDTFKDIKVWSSQGLKQRKFPDVIHKQRKFPDVIHTDRQIEQEPRRFI